MNSRTRIVVVYYILMYNSNTIPLRDIVSPIKTKPQLSEFIGSSPHSIPVKKGAMPKGPERNGRSAQRYVETEQDS